MNEIKDYSENLKLYASFFDSIGDYKSADECQELMLKLSEFKDDNIRIAGWNPLKGLERTFRKTIVNPIKQLGKNIDQTVRKYIPGGWVTVIGAAVSLGALGPQNAQYLNRFFTKGGGLDKLMASGPMGKALGTTIMNVGAQQVSKLAGGQTGQIPGQPGASSMSGLPTSNVPQAQLDAQLNYYYNTLYNNLFNIKDKAKRQAELNRAKSSLPGEVSKNFPQLSGYVPYIIQEVVKNINSMDPNIQIS